ncbi:MAG: CDP-alcohol phosphatidyltransferase family protein [Syntrophobacteraceae bacterium]
MTIPNLLTIGRICLTPVLVWLLLKNRLNEALVVFFIAGISDGLDGLLARVLNQKSRFGAYLDPLADKILLVTSFMLLGYTERIPSWLVIIVVSRDVMILLGLFTLFFHQIKFEMKPLVSSKLTTFFQLFTVFVLLARDIAALPSLAYLFIFLITAGFSIFSGGHYLIKGLVLLDQYRSRNHNDKKPPLMMNNKKGPGAAQQ